MFYIFYGDEEFTRSEAVANLRARMAEDDLGDLNTTSLDGRELALDDLINACNTMPFLTQRRMVIVYDMLQRFQRAGGAKEAERLAVYLPTMPDTTRLLFVESGSLHKNNPLLTRVQDLAGGHVREYIKLAPGSNELRAWVAQRTRSHGVGIEPRAIELLIEQVGNDLRALDQELAKLAGWAAYERTLSVEDVRALASTWPQTDIFGMVDALGLKDRRVALRCFHTLVDDDANALYLLTMIVRQIRLLLSAKDLRENERLSPADIGKTLGLRPFVVEKLSKQAGGFGFDELSQLLQRTLEVDQGIKTGQVEPILALEMLIIDICRRPTAPPAVSQRSRNRSRTR
jgi:DNA polymerase III subunit delta